MHVFAMCRKKREKSVVFSLMSVNHSDDFYRFTNKKKKMLLFNVESAMETTSTQ